MIRRAMTFPRRACPNALTVKDPCFRAGEVPTGLSFSRQSAYFYDPNRVGAILSGGVIVSGRLEDFNKNSRPVCARLFHLIKGRKGR